MFFVFTSDVGDQSTQVQRVFMAQNLDREPMNGQNGSARERKKSKYKPSPEHPWNKYLYKSMLDRC